MPLAAVVPFLGTATGAALAGSALTAGVGMYSAKKAASAQRRAAQQAAQTAKETYQQQVGLQQPYLTQGIGGVNELARQLGVSGDATSAGYGSLTTPFSMADFTADPGYGFRLSEGQKALERTAAARGGLLSGASIKGALRYGEDLASQEYQNAFNRYASERDARYNKLLGLTNVGQGAVNTLTGAAGTKGANVANAATAAGEATASGYVGAGNALNTGIQNISSYFQNKPMNDMLNRYYQNVTSTVAPRT
jgi:hypothetical protein